MPSDTLSTDAAAYAAIASEQASSAATYASTAAAFASSATTQAAAAAASAAAASAAEAGMVDNAASLAAQVVSLTSLLGGAPAAATTATTQAANALASAGLALTYSGNASTSASLAASYAMGFTIGTVTSGPLAATITGAPGFLRLNLVIPSVSIVAPTSSVLGGVFSSTAPANQFATGVSLTGAVSYAQPTFTNIAGTITATQLPYPTAITIGGVQSLVATSGLVMTGISSLGIPTVASDAVGFRNRIINGSFVINQRAVAGSVVLAAGAFGHDRAKAGAAGCTYTFVASGIDTILTITAGTLIFPIENLMIEGGIYSLSQAGTAQARVWQGTGTTGSGAYASAPIQVGALSAATQTNVEFSIGTILRPQFEPGLYVTAFERRPPSVELALCQRYFAKTFPQAVAPIDNSGSYGGGIGVSVTANASFWTGTWAFPVTMRANPVINTYNWSSGTAGYWKDTGGTTLSQPLAYAVGDRSVMVALNNGASYTAAGADMFLIHLTASAEI